MALGNFTSNQGTQTPIIVDTIGGSVMAIQKVDISPLGADGTIWNGNVGVSSGTINVSTISALPNLPQGSINVTAGTVNAGTVNVATITGGTLQNLVSGTINAATVVVNSATISVLPNTPGGTLGLITRVGNVGTLEVATVSSLPNLPQGSINVTAGTITTGTVNTGTINVATVTTGSIRVTLGTTGGAVASGAAASGNPNIVAGTDSGGTVYAMLVDIKGQQILGGGTIDMLKAGTISTLPNIPGGSIVVTTGTIAAHAITAATITEGTLRNLISGTINSATAVLNSGTINVGTFVMPSGTLNVATISTLPNLPQGSINVTAGTITNLLKAEDAGHSSGDSGVMALAVRNDNGTALATTDLDYIPLQTDANGALRIAGTVATGAGTQPVRLIDGTLTLGTVVGKDANAAAQVGNPIGVGGTDSGGTIRTINVDSSGAVKTATTVTAQIGTINVGTINTGTVNVATITAGTLTNLISGTINSATAVVNSATISVLPNLPQGSINVTAGTIATLGTMGTLGLVNTVTTVSNITNGSIVQTVGTVNAGTVNVGTITVGTVYKGVAAPAAGSLTAAGTITSAGSQLDVTFWEVGGTWVGTAFFEAQVGTSTYFAAPVITSLGAMGTVTTGNGNFMQSMAGVDNARLRVTYSSGTLTYNTRASNFYSPLTYSLGGTIGNIGMINAATISVIPNLPQGSINVTAGTITAGTINTGTINAGTINAATITAGTVSIAVGTINHGTIDTGTVRLDARTTQNVITFGTNIANSGAAAATIVGSTSVGVGTSLWLQDVSVLNPNSAAATVILGFGTAQQGTNVLLRGILGTSGAVGIEKPFAKAVNAGMTNQDLVFSTTGAGTMDLTISYLISA